MSQIGIPGVINFRRTIPAETNPLDKSTVVSILPKDIREIKYTIQPGVFEIPSGTLEVPAILVVGSSSWWKDVGEDQPLLEIPQSSIQVARSIVNDYCNGLLACNMSDSMPGLFFIPGEIGSVKELRDKHLAILTKANENQKRWFANLVKMADSLWSRTNGNPLAISDDMRLAARLLGLNTKEWLQDFQAMETIRCVACGFMRNAAFPVCPNCKAVIDVARAKELNLKFVE